MLEKSVDPRKVFFRQQSLCDTLAGNSCSLVTITACPSSRAWKHLHQLRKSDTKTRNESDVYSCVSTHLWSECLMLLWVCFQQWISVCVCARIVWQIFKALRASELWHLLSEEELRSFSVGGWVDVCGEDTVRWDDSTWITTWSICYTRRQKVKRDLRAHMDWEEVGFRFFFFFLVTSKVT